MNLSIVIVNYQTYELTRDTINSILEYSYPFTYEIIVVDNASSDDSLVRLKDYFKDKKDIEIVPVLCENLPTLGKRHW